MKATVNYKEFVKSLKTAMQAAVKGKSTLPACNNVLISAVESGLELICTDLDVRIAVAQAAFVEEQGRISVNAEVLAGWLKSVKSEIVEISDLGFTAGNSSTSIRFDVIEDFPVEPELDGEYTEITIDADHLASVLDHTVFAVDLKASRQVLRGVRLEVRDNTLTAVGTNGKHLAFMSVPCLCSKDMGFTIPASATKALHLSGNVILRIYPDKFKVIADGVCIISRLLDGFYPNWRQVVPKSTAVPFSAKVKASDLMQLPKVKSEVRAVFKFTVGQLSILWESNGGRERIDIGMEYNGPEVEHTLDLGNVGAALKRCQKGDMVTIHFAAEFAPLLFNFNGWDWVIMPFCQVQ